MGNDSDAGQSRNALDGGLVNQQGVIAGLDPGEHGAIAFIDPEEHTLELFDMPSFQIKPGQKKKKVIDHVGVADSFREKTIITAYIEEVNAMPHQGVVSMFTLGRNFGTLFGVAGGLQIPVTQVRPAVWKKNLKVPADKDAARYRASQLMPRCSSAWKKKDQDGRAEAALIALYGLCDLGYQLKGPIRLLDGG